VADNKDQNNDLFFSHTRFQWSSQEGATEAYHEAVQYIPFITHTISFSIILVLSSHKSYVSEVIIFSGP
jgi:hypothetical protein